MAALVLGVLIGVLIAGCGQPDEQFTSGEAQRAIAALDAIEQNVGDGRCATARRRVDTLVLQAGHVNDDRPSLGDAYAQSVSRLQELIDRECVEVMPTSPTPSVSEPTESTGGRDQTPTGGGGSPTPTPETPGPENPGTGGNQGGDNEPDSGGDTAPPEDSGGAGPGT